MAIHSLGPNADWRRLVLHSWPAVNASDLLQGNQQVWIAEGLTAPNDDEAVALAAMGRMVRCGQSIFINLPISREVTLTRLAFYLHRLRLDAAQGLMRTFWLNRVTVAKRVDLLVFGRPRRLLRDFVTSTVMRPTVVDINHPLEPAEFQRTLLANGLSDLLNTLEQLEKHCRPFAIVVDVTAQGCGENAVGLIKALPTFFDKVPIIALGYIGQVMAEPLMLHTWNVRAGDAVPLTHSGRPANAKVLEVIAAHDPLMDSFAKRLGFLVWNLKRLAEGTGGRTPELTALLIVDRVLRGLNVPLAVHEQGMLRQARGGQFAVRTVERWLEIASGMRGRRADIQSLCEEVLSLIQINFNQLKDGVHGRCELILHLGKEALTQRKSLSILVGSKRDAVILQNWLEEKLGLDSIDLISVSAMDGLTSIPPDNPAITVYAAPLFPSRLHWLGLTSARKIILSHPFERERVCTQVDRWWRANGLMSSLAGDKYHLWSMNWKSNTPLCDLTVEDAVVTGDFVSYQEIPFDGNYAKVLRVARMDLSRQFDDWLQMLLVEPAYSEKNIEDEPEYQESGDLIVIHLDSESHPLRWPENRQILRLDGDDFSVCSARELGVGNDLVLLGISEERVATQHELFDMFVQNNYGLQQTLRIAEKWQEYVDFGMAKYETVGELTKYLKSRKYQITAGTVHHWHSGHRIGPKDPAAIRLLAELAEVPNAERMAKMVENAIQVIRSEHQKIGRDLRKAVALTRSKDVAAVQIGSRRFSRDVFDSMVRVCRILKVEHPTYLRTGVSHAKTKITSVANEFAICHSDKLIFTAACERSMARSGFEDIDAFVAILNVVVQGFYPMYAQKSMSLKDVEDMLSTIPASYTGKTSDVTKGKFSSDYFKLYEGRKVDISRHIRLGTSFDPRYTLRLYFHWDDDAKKIVIHHAGEHLPTQNS